jgi:hypothetical protein
MNDKHPEIEKALAWLIEAANGYESTAETVVLRRRSECRREATRKLQLAALNYVRTVRHFSANRRDCREICGERASEHSPGCPLYRSAR